MQTVLGHRRLAAEEWHAKFSARAKARLTKDDHDEEELFPFKQVAQSVGRTPKGSYSPRGSSWHLLEAALLRTLSGSPFQNILLL